MLVHICCSVDSHFFLQQLQKEYPDEKITCFFYDPNIHPYSEYKLRFYDVKYSCKKLDIELIEGPYDLENWFKLVKGLENEPEKGDRCTVCFDNRLEVSVKKALELDHNKFTTTLLISPKKSQDKLKTIGEKLSSQYNCEFIFKDYRSGNGMELQAKEVKENSLYRQNYCGCIFGLTAQREQQNKFLDELISPINQQVFPESIEERLKLYEKRNELEENSSPYKIIKQRFLNYRILSGLVKIKKEVIPSYFLCYSTLKNKKSNGRIEYSNNEIHYLNRDEIKIITIDTFNKLSSSNYSSAQELYFQPLEFSKEKQIKEQITNNSYDLSTVIVLDDIPDSKVEIYLDSTTFEDVKEEII